MLDVIIASLLGMDALDERFIAHRHRSSRLALAVGCLLMGGWFFYDLVLRDTLRHDLLIILAAMALTKIGAMLWLRFTQ